MKKKKRVSFKENNKKKLIKLLDGRKKEYGLNDLPTVLIKHLASYLDFDSLLQFSSANQRFRIQFQNPRKGFFHLIELEFFSSFNFEYDLISKKEFFKQIIKNKQIPLLRDKNNCTPLHLACKIENITIEMVKYFVENKIDLNVRDNCFDSAIHHAVRNENISLEIIECLVENKSDLNLQDFSKNTPLHQLIKLNNVRKGNLPSFDIIKFLIEKNSDLNLKDDNDSTPLHLIIKNKNVSIDKIKLFVENKSELNLKDKFNLKTPLHFAFMNKEISFEIVKYLIENKSDLNSKDINNFTPLDYAFKNDSLRQQVIRIYGECDNLEHILKLFQK